MRHIMQELLSTSMSNGTVTLAGEHHYEVPDRQVAKIDKLSIFRLLVSIMVAQQRLKLLQ